MTALKKLNKVISTTTKVSESSRSDSYKKEKFLRKKERLNRIKSNDTKFSSLGAEDQTRLNTHITTLETKIAELS
jgi:hypothetical protein